MADRELGKLFRKAEKELNKVAKNYGFSLRLTDTTINTWMFYPEVSHLLVLDADKYPMSDWRMEVINGTTVLGYSDWKRHRIEAEDDGN